MFIFSKPTITTLGVILVSTTAIFGQAEPAVAYHPRVVQAWFSPGGGMH
jgi:hypothetical protein